MRYLLTLVLFIAACSPPTDTIARITPLPTQDTAGQPTSAVTSAPTLTPGATRAVAAAPTSAAAATPLDLALEAGSAREIAAATDMAITTAPENRLTFDQNPAPIEFDEFYDGYNMRTGLILSDKLLSLDGQNVLMEGYMAPPLKARIDYFVLTRIRLSFCPFCTTGADWPDDIALVYMPPAQSTVATDRPVRVLGRLELGASVDQETGMVSMVRIYADTLEPIG